MTQTLIVRLGRRAETQALALAARGFQEPPASSLEAALGAGGSDARDLRRSRAMVDPVVADAQRERGQPLSSRTAPRMAVEVEGPLFSLSGWQPCPARALTERRARRAPRSHRPEWGGQVHSPAAPQRPPAPLPPAHLRVLGMEVVTGTSPLSVSGSGCSSGTPMTSSSCPPSSMRWPTRPSSAGYSRDEVSRRVATALDAVGMSGCGRKHPLNLSIGQKKRSRARIGAGDRQPAARAR